MVLRRTGRAWGGVKEITSKSQKPQVTSTSLFPTEIHESEGYYKTAGRTKSYWISACNRHVQIESN